MRGFGDDAAAAGHATASLIGSPDAMTRCDRAHGHAWHQRRGRGLRLPDFKMMLAIGLMARDGSFARQARQDGLIACSPRPVPGADAVIATTPWAAAGVSPL